MQKIRNIAIYRPRGPWQNHTGGRMILQAKLFGILKRLGELILDNNDLERERGITILRKMSLFHIRITK